MLQTEIAEFPWHVFDHGPAFSGGRFPNVTTAKEKEGKWKSNRTTVGQEHSGRLITDQKRPLRKKHVKRPRRTLRT